MGKMVSVTLEIPEEHYNLLKVIAHTIDVGIGREDEPVELHAAAILKESLGVIAIRLMEPDIQAFLDEAKDKQDSTITETEVDETKVN